MIKCLTSSHVTSVRRVLLCSGVLLLCLTLCRQSANALGQSGAPGLQAQVVPPTVTPPNRVPTSVVIPKRDPQQGGIIESIFNYIINATVYFPARTFQEAFEKASTNILAGQLDRVRGPLQEVLHIYAFTNAAVFGNAPIPAEVKQIGQRLTEAAVPIWVLSLVLVALSALTRNASGQPIGLIELAEEGARWLFVAIASGNGAGIVSWAHMGFGALAFTIASSGGAVSAGEFVGAFFPSMALAKTWPLLLLVFATILGFIVIVVLAITYIARYALLFAITGLAPICIALGGISFTRFAFREWLSMFMRLEFLQLINVTVLVIFKTLGFLAAANAGSVTQAILLITVMLGLSSALIGINVAAFKQVFGTALDVASQMRAAASSLVSGLVQMGGVVIGAAMSGGTGALPAALATAAMGPGGSLDPAAGREATERRGDSQVHGDEALGFGSAMARAWSNATGSSFAKGLADGTGARLEQQRHRNISARVEEQQRATEQRRAESLARETGASSSDDVEAIAADITSPQPGRSREQMIRAYRDSAGLLREMAKAYGGPAQAATVAGYQNFAALAKALVDERLHQSGQTANTDSAAETTTEESPNQVEGTGRASSTQQPAANMTGITGHSEDGGDTRQTQSVPPATPVASRMNTPTTESTAQASGGSVAMSSASITSTTPMGDGSKPMSGVAPDVSADVAVSSVATQQTDVVAASINQSATGSAVQGSPVPGSLSSFAAQVPQTPLQDWVSSTPQMTEPGNQSMLPFDFGVGGLLTNSTGSDPSHAPLWAKTAHSLRMAYGEDYVQGLLAQAQQGQLDESQLMEQIDQEVASHSSTRSVARFWRPDGGFSHHLDAQNQA